MQIRNVVVSLYSDLQWRYRCTGCHRTAGAFFIEATAQRDADTHLCDAPRPHEMTDAEWTARGVTPVAR